MGATFALVGVLLLGSAAWEWRERAAYLRAPACAGDATDGCVVDTVAIVESKHVSRLWGRLDRYYVTLWLYPGQRVRDETDVELPEPDAVWDNLTAERAVGVRLWDERVARVDVAGRSAETAHSPVTTAVERTLGGVGGVSCGLLGLYAGTSMVRRHGWVRSPELAPIQLRRGVLRAVVATIVATAVASVVTSSLDVYSPPRLLLASLPVWLVAWLLLGRTKPA